MLLQLCGTGKGHLLDGLVLVELGLLSLGLDVVFGQFLRVDDLFEFEGAGVLAGIVVETEVAHFLLEVFALASQSFGERLVRLFLQLFQNVDVDLGLVGRFGETGISRFQAVVILVVLLGRVHVLLVLLVALESVLFLRLLLGYELWLHLQFGGGGQSVV